MNTPAQTFPQSLRDIDLIMLLDFQGSEEEKQAFIQEMQNAVWQDIADTDLVGQLTDTEMEEIMKMLSDETVPAAAKQEMVTAQLMGKFPNIKEIVSHRALQFKADLFRERAEGIKMHYASNPENVQKVEQALATAQGGDYVQAAQLLKQL